LVHQFIDPPELIYAFPDRIFHAHVKDSKVTLTGRNSILSSHLGFGDRRRGWDFVSPGRGDVEWDPIVRALNRIGYQGPLSIEWEDSGMDRDFGAPEALAMIRGMDFAPSAIAFDAAFTKK
jgi:sugar phosphate isomerase/epimerase